MKNRFLPLLLAGLISASSVFAEAGAAVNTHDYTSPFKTVLGKTDSEISTKLNDLWYHFFKGSNNQKIFYDKGSEAYILDISNNDVRSWGMACGMLICVQTDHKSEFDKLWNFAKNHMWHKSGARDGYFSSIVHTDGSVWDSNSMPSAEMHFMMSLLLASSRWNEDQYAEDALYIMNKMWNNSTYKLFNETSHIISFQPAGVEKDFTDPSYDLPAFIDYFSRMCPDYKTQWEQAASKTREHLRKSSNASSGLFTEYNNFDGTPHAVSFNPDATKFFTDARLCAMNIGADYYLFGADAANQKILVKRLIDFFENDNYQHCMFDWDGSNPAMQYSVPLGACNAVACYALLDDPSYSSQVEKILNWIWNSAPETGQWRYLSGIPHLMAMLHLCGSFKLWGLIPPEGVDESSANATDVELFPNPSKDYFEVRSSSEIKNIEIASLTGQTLLKQDGGSPVHFSLPAGTYLVKVQMADGHSAIKKIVVK